MDETIDLRPYVEGLLRRWRVILGAVIAGILIAVILYFLQSKYQATALVAVTDPTQRLQFDERIINTLDLDILLQAYPELAMSDGVLSSLLPRAIEMSNGEIEDLPQLRKVLDVETGADPRLIRLSVRNGDPEFTASLANAWAEAFVSVVDSIYFNSSREIAFFNDQLALTDAQLQAAEQALVEFQAGSRMVIIDNELNSLNELQASYLANQNRLRLVLEDIRTLYNQIESGGGDAITWADQLTALTLQMRIYEAASDASVTDNPLQLQLNPQADLTTGQRAEQLQLLDELTQTAEATLGEIEVKLLGLEPRIFELQRGKQELFHQYEKLIQNRDVAKETYTTLARKIDEVRIQSEDTGQSLQVASLAATPAEPERSNLVVTALIASLAAFLLSAAAIIAVTWWKTTSGQATPQS